MPFLRSDTSDEDVRPDKPDGSRSAHNSHDSSSPESTKRRSGSILHRFRGDSRDSDPMLANDPTIKAARQKVTDAERAEHEADRALEMARSAVREAHQHVKNLETAALAEIRRARAKHQEAKNIKKGASRLGRHDHS